jgi:hypothetical protein
MYYNGLNRLSDRHFVKIRVAQVFRTIGIYPALGFYINCTVLSLLNPYRCKGYFSIDFSNCSKAIPPLDGGGMVIILYPL